VQLCSHARLRISRAMADAEAGGAAEAGVAPAAAPKLNAFLLRCVRERARAERQATLRLTRPDLRVSAPVRRCSTPENADHNQYWYSTHTIATLIQARAVL